MCHTLQHVLPDSVELAHNRVVELNKSDAIHGAEDDARGKALGMGKEFLRVLEQVMHHGY